MGERVRHMLIKEFIQVLRDPRMKAVLFVMPVVQLVVFGYAISTDVRHVPTAVFDRDQSVASRELISRFAGSNYFDIVEYVSEERRARQVVDEGRALALLRFEPGYENDLRAGRTAPLQMILDGTDSNTAGIVLNYAARIVGDYNDQVLRAQADRLQGAASGPGRVELRSRAWFNENLESRNFYVPGVIAVLVALITLLMTSMAVVREKEIGTMEQILVTPIRPVDFILGKTLPFALVSFVDVIVITLVGVLWFDVPVRGNLVLLFVSTALFLLTTLGTGLLISTVSQTQQQALMGTFFFYMPAMLLSGFMFPIANMPRVVQWLTLANPLRYFLVIVRGIFLKGAGFGILWPQMLGLAVLGALTLGFASRRFRKTLA